MLIASSDAIVYASKSIMLIFRFCCWVKGMYWLREVVVESVGGMVYVGYGLGLFCGCFVRAELLSKKQRFHDKIFIKN